VVELLGEVAQGLLEDTEVDHHTTTGTIGAERLLAQMAHHAPAMPMEVLALAVVVR